MIGTSVLENTLIVRYKNPVQFSYQDNNVTLITENYHLVVFKILTRISFTKRKAFKG